MQGYWLSRLERWLAKPEIADTSPLLCRTHGYHKARLVRALCCLRLRSPTNGSPTTTIPCAADLPISNKTAHIQPSSRTQEAGMWRVSHSWPSHLASLPCQPRPLQCKRRHRWLEADWFREYSSSKANIKNATMQPHVIGTVVSSRLIEPYIFLLAPQSSPPLLIEEAFAARDNRNLANLYR